MEEVEASTLATLRGLGRNELAGEIETHGLPQDDRRALEGQFDAFQKLAFADKIDAGTTTIIVADYLNADPRDYVNESPPTRWIT